MEKQIILLSQVPFPSDPHLQCWITSTFYVLTSEGESVPLWSAEEATINSYEPALVSSLTTPSWVWLTHCYTLLIPHIKYMTGPTHAPHGTSCPCNYDILCLLWHQLCARFLFHCSVSFILLCRPLGAVQLISQPCNKSSVVTATIMDA